MTIPIAILALVGVPLIPIGDALGWSAGAIGTALVGVLVVALVVQGFLIDFDDLDRRWRRSSK